MLVKINDAKKLCSINPDYFKQGDQVTIAFGGKIVAAASACHIGSSANEACRGSLSVNDGKALIKIVDISYPNAKSPCSDGAFSKTKALLGDYVANEENKFIVIPTSSICKLVSNISILKENNFVSTEDCGNDFSEF